MSTAVTLYVPAPEIRTLGNFQERDTLLAATIVLYDRLLKPTSWPASTCHSPTSIFPIPPTPALLTTILLYICAFDFF